MICSASQIDSFWKTFVLSKRLRVLDAGDGQRAAALRRARWSAGELPLAARAGARVEPPLELPQPATTTATAAMTMQVLILWTRMFPSSGERLALALRTVYNTQASMSRHADLPVGSRRTGGPQAAVADGGRLARPAHHQRRERARRAADRAAARRARRASAARPCARRCGSWRGEGLVEITPRHGAASRARRGARRPRAVRVPAAAGAALRVRGGGGDHARRAWPSSSGSGRRWRRRRRTAGVPGARTWRTSARWPSTARTRCCASSSS